MAYEGRVVTTKLPDDTFARLDKVAGRIERSKSWIVREAVQEWLSEEQRRYELTLEALRSIDEGRGIDHEDVRTWAEELKREVRAKSPA